MVTEGNRRARDEDITRHQRRATYNRLCRRADVVDASSPALWAVGYAFGGDSGGPIRGLLAGGGVPLLAMAPRLRQPSGQLT